jgi:hypothetical protein
MHLNALICSYSSSVDIRTNQVSIFNIIDSIISSNFPIALGPISVLIILTRDPDEQAPSLRLQIKIEDQILADGPIMVDFQEQFGTRTFAEIGALVIPGPGILTFSLLKDGTEWGKWIAQVVNPGPTITQPEAIHQEDLKPRRNSKMKSSKT